jgi:hypothetical protein
LRDSWQSAESARKIQSHCWHKNEQARRRMQESAEPAKQTWHCQLVRMRISVHEKTESDNIHTYARPICPRRMPAATGSSWSHSQWH